MDSDEKIVAHVVSVWRESKKFFSIGGREGMLFLTNKHLMFTIETAAKMKWWQAVRQRQALAFLKSDNIMIRHDGYEEEDLRMDLENKKNLEIPFDDILDIKYEKKIWGGVLSLKFQKKDKMEKFQFAVAQDWVKYPAKEPTKYMKVDWTPFVQYIKERQKIKE